MSWGLLAVCTLLCFNGLNQSCSLIPCSIYEIIFIRYLLTSCFGQQSNVAMDTVNHHLSFIAQYLASVLSVYTNNGLHLGYTLHMITRWIYEHLSLIDTNNYLF